LHCKVALAIDELSGEGHSSLVCSFQPSSSPIGWKRALKYITMRALRIEEQGRVVQTHLNRGAKGLAIWCSINRTLKSTSERMNARPVT
jgi:hypothetical protein